LSCRSITVHEFSFESGECRGLSHGIRVMTGIKR